MCKYIRTSGGYAAFSWESASASEEDFGRHDRDTDQRDADEINEDECPAAILTGDVGKTPDITEPYRRTGCSKNKHEP